MSKILMWEKPEKIMSVEKWKSISADGAPPGVYTPNMSKEDMLKWKAKLIKGATPRVEIRKTFQKGNGKGYPSTEKYVGVYCQTLIIVSQKNIDGMIGCNALISMNGKCGMSFQEVAEFEQAINEASTVLMSL
jgi:hypothetical protein